MLTEELDAGLVLVKSLFATGPGVSVSRNRFGPYWGSTSMVIRKLYERRQYGWDHLSSHANRSTFYLGKRAIYKRPTNFEVPGG